MRECLMNPDSHSLIATLETSERDAPKYVMKFTAALQNADAGNNPILLRIESVAAHGVGTPLTNISTRSAIFIRSCFL